MVAPLDSRERENEPLVIENLNGCPVLTSVWLNSRHFLSSSDIEVIFSGEGDIREVTHTAWFLERQVPSSSEK